MNLVIELDILDIFICNVTCVCVMSIFSLTGLTSFKDYGLWRNLWLCSVDSGMLWQRNLQITSDQSDSQQNNIQRWIKTRMLTIASTLTFDSYD